MDSNMAEINPKEAISMTPEGNSEYYPKIYIWGSQIGINGQKCCFEKWRVGLSKSLKSKLLIQIDSNRAENDSE